jgi:deoxycytidylate deaminase
MGKHDITAIITDRRGRVLSIGKNSYVKTHPEMKKLSIAVHGNDTKLYLHAEVDALIKVPKKKRHKMHKIFVERKAASGQPMLAAPCPVCQAAIKQYGVKKISYTVSL